MIPKDLRRQKSGIVRRNVKERARCDTDPLGGDDTNTVYAQRQLDPSTCNDLLSRHVFEGSSEEVMGKVKSQYQKLLVTRNLYGAAGLKMDRNVGQAKGPTKAKKSLRHVAASLKVTKGLGKNENHPE